MSTGVEPANPCPETERINRDFGTIPEEQIKPNFTAAGYPCRKGGNSMNRVSERIVIVDPLDQILGEEDKEKCHDGDGILHRGFLAMVFNREGELLLTRRSVKKRLWPGFWDGSVASHLFSGEDYVQASIRRLRQELGISVENMEYAFKFRYQAGYGSIGTEHEICAVTIVRGVGIESVRPDSDEIAEIRTADLKALIEEVRENGRRYTPWLVLALEHMSERPLQQREERIRATIC
jgi:isopentenyl-diphosphate delta-isomerase